MKNWLTQVAAAAFAVVALASCQKDEDKVTVTPSTTSALTASSTSVVLKQANSAQPALTYNWTPVSAGLTGTSSAKAPAVSYQLQVAKSADGFGYPAAIDASTSTSKDVTVGELNTALTTLGLAPNVANSVYVRVVAVVGSDTHSFASNPVQLTATSYKVCLPPNSDSWSIIGPAGVDWNTDVALAYNCDTKTYDITRTLNAGEFKFRKNAQWNVAGVATNYGASARNSSGTAPLVLDGPNISVPTTGTYTISFDLATETYTLK